MRSLISLPITAEMGLNYLPKTIIKVSCQPSQSSWLQLHFPFLRILCDDLLWDQANQAILPLG